MMRDTGITESLVCDRREEAEPGPRQLLPIQAKSRCWRYRQADGRDAMTADHGSSFPAQPRLGQTRIAQSHPPRHPPSELVSSSQPENHPEP
eukprot:3941613-Rhodomonas_salina.10